MEAIYECMESILPFSFMHYDFMKNALLAVLLLTPIFGMIGFKIKHHDFAILLKAEVHRALNDYFFIFKRLIGACEQLICGQLG